MTCMTHCCGSSPELRFTRACRRTPHIIPPLAPSSTAIPGWLACNAFGIFPRNRPDKTFSISHVAAIYMAAHIAREEDWGQ